MSGAAIDEAVAASRRLLDRGDVEGAIRVLDEFAGDQTADLQRGAVATASILLDGRQVTDAEAILTPHLDSARALDLIGVAHYHSAITTKEHPLHEAVGECTAASRMSFGDPCWKVANTLHIGMIQQQLGSHDIAEVYLREAYRAGELCPAERATAARHLGFDARARGDDDAALELLEESLALRRLNTIAVSIPEALVAVAEALELSRPEQSTKLLDEAVELARTHRSRRPLAHALAARGRFNDRRSELAEARAIASDLEDRVLMAALDELL